MHGSAKHPAVRPSENAVFELMIFRDFAERRGLEIVESIEDSSNRSEESEYSEILSQLSDEVLLAEVKRRNLL